MVKWLDDSSDTNSISDELPWYKDYIGKTKDTDFVVDVLEVYDGERGLLLLTPKFKAFIFRRQKQYSFLIEALSHWIVDSQLPCHLIAGYKSNTEIRLGLNDEIENTYWVKEDNAYKRKSSIGDSTESIQPPNPLLPTGVVSTDTAQLITLPRARKTKQ